MLSILTTPRRSKVDEAHSGDCAGHEGRLRRSLRLSGSSQVRDAFHDGGSGGGGGGDDALQGEQRQGLPGNVPLDVLARLPDHKAQQRLATTTQSTLKATPAPHEAGPKRSSMVPSVRHPVGM